MAHSFSLQERKIYIPAVSCNERWYSGNLNMPYKKLAEVSKYFCGNGNFYRGKYFFVYRKKTIISILERIARVVKGCPKWWSKVICDNFAK